MCGVLQTLKCFPEAWKTQILHKRTVCTTDTECVSFEETLRYLRVFSIFIWYQILSPIFNSIKGNFLEQGSREKWRKIKMHEHVSAPRGFVHCSISCNLGSLRSLDICKHPWYHRHHKMTSMRLFKNMKMKKITTGANVPFSFCLHQITFTPNYPILCCEMF